MPGSHERMYTAVPLHHTAGEVRQALRDELVDSKMNAIESHIALKQETLLAQRSQIFQQGNPASKSYIRTKRQTNLMY